MKVIPIDADVRQVVSAIPEGRENAIPRAELVAALGMNDRTVRACIEAARRDGVFIISIQERGGGYYRATEPEEIERQYHIDRARALSILARLTPMRRYLRAAGRPLK